MVDVAGGAGSQATNRLCRSCAAAVEAAMKVELQTRAQAQRPRPASRKPVHEAWAVPSSQEERVPAEMRDAVLRYVTACPRTLHEITSWLQRSLRIEEGAVESFLAELNGVVRATAISNRVSSPSAPAQCHLVVYISERSAQERASEESGGLDQLKRLWDSE